MSILLEALKKSEEQRQLGSTPTLQTTVASHAGAGNRVWIPIFMLVSAAAAMSWIGWEQFRQPEMSVEPAAAAASPVLNNADGSGQAQDVSAAQLADVATPLETTAATTAASSSRPAEKRKSGALDVDEKRRRLAKSVKSYASERPTPPPLTSKVRAQASRARHDEAADIPQPQATRSTAIAPSADQSQSHETDSISFWQMPSSLRESMPELRLTVLVYAERPEDRFLLINGQRLREHEELESGVVLEEIQRTRAIFSYRNYRFHLKS